MINLSAMDMGLSIGFFAIFALFGSLNYATIFSITPFMNETATTIIGLLLLSGAMAKSAQIPLHSWLPGSMEGLKYYFIILFLLIFYYLSLLSNDILYINIY
jgi:NADH:ubiquinone oxidoreductase subunit 5 (subunit L)/multisubunit Na+/H+ antiporter MnhA subunit